MWLHACLQVKEEYIGALEALVLPVEEDRLEATHNSALSAALAVFDENSFGVTGSPDLNVRPWTACSTMLPQPWHHHMSCRW